MLRVAGVGLLAIVVGACTTVAVGQAPASIAPIPLFGPVVGADVIGGRADDEDVTLLAGGMDVVRIDLDGRRVERTRLLLAPGESCWGLARLSNGSVWTLKGRRTLARIAGDGRLIEEVSLAAPLFGVFAAGDRLVYQEATFTPPSPALQTESAGTRVPWSGITTRPFERLARASAAALNLLSCGATRTRERACWFPEEAAVFFVDVDGHTRRTELVGLSVVSPEILLTSDNPPRPVRDAYVFADTELWVLSTGTPPIGGDTAPGGWILARYGADGRPEGQARLTEAARLILRVDRDRIVLLLSSGKVGEVRKW